MIRPSAAAAVLALAACGGDPAGAPADVVATPAIDYAGRIRALPAGQRTAVFLRAVRDAGRDCQQVSAVQEVSAQGGPATWLATCGDGARWLVAIAADGTAVVTPAPGAGTRAG